MAHEAERASNTHSVQDVHAAAVAAHGRRRAVMVEGDGVDLGSGRIVGSEIEAPNMLVNLVSIG